MKKEISFNTEFNRFLWSSILIALSACLGNVVDSIIVGNLIGEDGVSAINLSKPVTQFMFTISMLLSTGAGMLVGMELGKKDYQRASYIFTLSTIGCLAFGLLQTVTGLFFTGDITGWLCTHEELFVATRDYLFPLMIGAPTYMMAWALATMVGVDGSPRLVSIAILIDNAVNLSCDIIFIQLFGWGIEGSSTATVVGHIVGIAMMCWHFRYPDHHLRMVLGGGKAWATLKDMVSQGAPLALASISLTALLFCANSIVLSTMGRVGIFAFSVCMNILYIYNLFLSGTCRTVQSLGSIQVGKGDNEKFRLVITKSFRFITIAMLITCAFIWMAPESITKFFGADEEDMIVEGVRALRIFGLSFIPFCYIYTIMVVYKLYGYHKIALFISLALSLTVIPVLWIVSHAAPDYLWYSYLIAYAIEAIAIVVLHKMAHVRFELKPLRSGQLVLTLLLMLLTATTAQAQEVKHIQPAEIHQMPKVSVEAYSTSEDEFESENLSDEEAQKLGDLTVYTDLYSGFCSWYCGGVIESVKASSCLKPMGRFDYQAKNAHDFNHKRVWAEGVPGPGIGEYLVYEFPGSCPRITTVKILNGHVKSEKAWRENGRPKTIKMYYKDKPYAILDLEDSRTLQCFEVGVLGFHDAQAPNWTLKFEILDVYPGTKYDDTVIAELYFDGIDVH